MSTKIEILESITNKSFCDFYLNFPKNSFIDKMSKSQAHTWKENLINTGNGNLPVKSTILQFTQIKLKLFSISKWAKLKLAKWAKPKSIL